MQKVWQGTLVVIGLGVLIAMSLDGLDARRARVGRVTGTLLAQTRRTIPVTQSDQFHLAAQPTGADSVVPNSASVVAGEVVSAESANPLSGVTVEIRSQATGISGRSITDIAGRFAFSISDPGRYDLSAMKPGYLLGRFGARLPGRLGTPLSVKAEGRDDALRIVLFPGGSVSGHLTVRGGMPSARTAVAALKCLRADCSGPTLLAGTTVTNAKGFYRLEGLLPGEYVLAATPVPSQPYRAPTSSKTTSNDNIELKDVASYYPGSASLAAASILRLGPTDRREAVDWKLEPVQVFTVSAALTAPPGFELNQLVVLIELTDSSGRRSVVYRSSSSQPLKANSEELRFRGVPSGNYELTATAQLPSSSRPVRYWSASAPLLVTDRDSSGISLVLTDSREISGSILFRANSERHPDISNASLKYLRTDTAADDWTVHRWPGIDPAGRFVLSPIAPGRTYELTVDRIGNDPAWKNWTPTFESFANAGRGISTETASRSIVVEFTEYAAEVVGNVSTAGGHAAVNLFMVIFPADHALWLPSRFVIQHARPDTEGEFSFVGLIPGRYHLTSLTDLDSDRLYDPVFLRSLTSTNPITIDLVTGVNAIRLTESDGRLKRVALVRANEKRPTK